jgi:RNA polymerase sigma-70 factor (ECF subfamily)
MPHDRDGSAPSPAPGAAPESLGHGLARLAGQGDPRATRQLLELVGPKIVRTARAVMGPHHPDLEDAVQLSLIGLIHALPSFRGECSPAQFAARIAVRTATATRRRSRTRGSREEVGPDLDAVAAQPSDPGAGRRSAVLRSLLDELPEEQAEALAMRVALGWSLKDIAETTNTPVNTVRSRMRLAKEALRRRIADDPGLLEELDLAGEP